MIIEHNNVKFYKVNEENSTVRNKILDDISKEYVPDFKNPSYGWTIKDFQSNYDSIIENFMTEYQIEGDITKRQIHYVRYAKGVAQEDIKGTDTMYQGSGFQLVHFVKLEEDHPRHMWNLNDPQIPNFSPEITEGDIFIYPNQEISCFSNVNNLDNEKIVVYYNFNITRL